MKLTIVNKKLTFVNRESEWYTPVNISTIKQFIYFLQTKYEANWII